MYIHFPGSFPGPGGRAAHRPPPGPRGAPHRPSPPLETLTRVGFWRSGEGGHRLAGGQPTSFFSSHWVQPAAFFSLTQDPTGFFRRRILNPQGLLREALLPTRLLHDFLGSDKPVSK